MNNTQNLIENGFKSFRDVVFAESVKQGSLTGDHVCCLFDLTFDKSLFDLSGQKFKSIHFAKKYEVEVLDNLDFEAIQEGSTPLWSLTTLSGECVDSFQIAPTWSYFDHADEDVKYILNRFFREEIGIYHHDIQYVSDLFVSSDGGFVPLLEVLKDLDCYRGSYDIPLRKHAQLRSVLRNWAIQ